MTELPNIPAVLPWPAGTTSYPPTVDTFIEQTEGLYAKSINDLLAAILAIENLLGTNPAGDSPTIKAALAELQGSLNAVESDQGNLAIQVAALQSVPGPSNTYFNYVQSVPASIWTIDHNLGRHPAVTVVDSGGSVVEGDVEFTSNTRVVLTFSAAFSGTASLS